MTKVEKVLIILTAISLILKLNLLPYSGLFLFFTLGGLGFYYLLFGKALLNKIKPKDSLRESSYKEIPKPLIVLSRVTGFSLSLICTGTLFKLNHWTYSSILIIIGLVLTFLVSVITLNKQKTSQLKIYKRILKRTTLGMIGAIVVLSTKVLFPNSQALNHSKDIKESSYQTDQINHWTFQYKLSNRKLVDTLKVINPDNNLVLFQNWNEGKLKKTFSVDQYGKIRELSFYSLQDSNSTIQYYYDINDLSFRTFPFNKTIFDFYENHYFLSLDSVKNNAINEINIFNYPIKHARLAVTKGHISFGNDIFHIVPKAQKGDTLKVLLNHPLEGKFTPKFDLIIK